MGRKETTKRKDSRGRVLQKGENQRADGTYMYRWTDSLGKRQTVYAKTLDELRTREFEVQKTERTGLVYSKGNIDGTALTERYLAQKKNLRPTSMVSYRHVVELFKNDQLSRVKIKDVKVFMCRDFMGRLKEKGFSTSYIRLAKKVLHGAFQMAVEDEAIIKNPFCFKLDFLEDDSRKRTALSPEEEMDFLEFLKSDKTYGCYYDLAVFMLNTGLRCGEVCGLTRRDIDMENRTLSVNKQLRHKDNEFVVCEPKSSAGYRMVYLNDKALGALSSILADRKNRQEHIIDGYGGFVFYTHTGKLLTANSLSQMVKRMHTRYIRERGENVPYISAHVFRHTFCTRLVDKGMNIKSVQKIMGHNSIEVTLGVYSHKDDNHAVEDMRSIM